MRSARERRSRAVLTVLGLVAACLTAGAPSQAGAVASPPRRAGATATPRTIPALRQWTAGTGSFPFTSTSRVVVDTRYAKQLSSTAALFVDDLVQLTGLTITTVVQRTPRAGDLYLTLGAPDPALGEEGYLLTVGSAVRVQARADAGVFYGTRTLLQLLRQSRTIPAGSARDWPTSPERGLMVDVGRKYFTLGWLRARVKDLAYQKLNYLHLHLSDNLGFRLESASHPEIVSPDHYTKRDIAALVALGARYHVQIVPEIDAPGHLDQVLASHPDLKLVASDGAVSNRFIDLSKPASYALIKDLITEYLPLFPSRYWHIGADEYVTDYTRYPQLLAYARSHYGPKATAKDTYYGYVNWADALVRHGGKTVRMWNDDLRSGDGTISANADIVVEHWYNRTRALTPQQLVDAGHPIMNGSYTQTYYVVGGSRKPDPTAMYETWTVNAFHGGLSLTPAAAQRNLGAKLHVWCDRPNGETEAEVATHIRDPLRVMAQQTWGSPKLVPAYADFQPIIAAIGTAPGA